MMKNYSGKIAFAGAMVAVALISRAVYPRLYSVATANPGATATSLSDAIPQFVLPALSLATASGPRFAEGSGEVSLLRSSFSEESEIASSSLPFINSSDGAASAGAVAGESPTGLSAATNASTISVVPPGPVANSMFSRVYGTAPPSLTVEAALVADITTGVRFMDENATERWPLASITKLMTATIVLDKLSSAQKITITEDAFNADPSEKTLGVGDTYTVIDLLRFLLLPSSNVAAEALARAYGRPQFIAAMNARAAAWGMMNTRYADPSGVAVGSQSTADDLVRLAQKIYSDYPEILMITRAPQATVTEISSGTEVAVKNINEFSGETDFVGGKTGYTDQANGNLLSIFSYEEHPIVVVVLGTDGGTRFADTKALYNWFTANFRS